MCSRRDRPVRNPDHILLTAGKVKRGVDVDHGISRTLARVSQYLQDTVLD